MCQSRFLIKFTACLFLFDWGQFPLVADDYWWMFSLLRSLTQRGPRSIRVSVGPLFGIRIWFWTHLVHFQNLNICSNFSIRSIFKTGIYLVFSKNLLFCPTLASEHSSELGLRLGPLVQRSALGAVHYRLHRSIPSLKYLNRDSLVTYQDSNIDMNELNWFLMSEAGTNKEFNAFLGQWEESWNLSQQITNAMPRGSYVVFVLFFNWTLQHCIAQGGFWTQNEQVLYLFLVMLLMFHYLRSFPKISNLVSLISLANLALYNLFERF